MLFSEWEDEGYDVKTAPGAVKVNRNRVGEAESVKLFGDEGLEVADNSEVTFDLKKVACYSVKFVCYYCKL